MINTLQTIINHSEIQSEQSQWSENMIEDYQGKFEDIQQLIEESNTVDTLLTNSDFSPKSGTGSPEGLVTANLSLQYVDTAVPTLFFNPVFGANTGWIAL